MERFIVKLQRSIRTTDPRGDVTLIYNEERSIIEQVFTAPELAKAFGGALKIFHWATLDEEGHLKISDKAPWQDW